VAAALLLSYLGYQSENPEAIEQGLQLVAEQGADSDRRFASLLRQLWLQDTAEQGDSRESDAGD